MPPRRHLLRGRDIPATAAGLTALVVGGLVGAGCPKGDKPPAPGTPVYEDVVRAFYTGLTALQTGENSRAEIHLTRAQQLAPQEPAVWADLGLLRIRQGKFEDADAALKKARELAPANAEIVALSGVLEARRNRYPEAAAYFQKAVELEPGNLRAAWALAQTGDQIGGPEGEKLSDAGLSRVLASRPDNLPALLAAARSAAKKGDAAGLRSRAGQIVAAVRKLPARPESPSAPLAEQVKALQAAVAGPNPRAAVTPLLYLNNVLKSVPAYQRALAEIETPVGDVGEPVERFLTMPAPRATAAPPDAKLSYAAKAPVNTGPLATVRAVYLDGADKPTLVTAGTVLGRLDASAALPLAGGKAPSGPDGVLALDGNYDFKTDLVVAGPGGVRVFQQGAAGVFTDVTARALPAALTGGAYTAAYVADFDLDGDLDLLLAKASGGLVALRNSGGGVYKPVPLFGAVTAPVISFAWSDVGGEGTPDAAIAEASGRVRVFANRRSGRFTELPAIDAGKAVSVAVADLTGSGRDTVVVLRADGTVASHAWDEAGGKWSPAEVAQSGVADAVRLIVADMDNNGAVDLVISGAKSGTRVLLGDGAGKFAPLADQTTIPLRTDDVADVDGDGLLDLVGVDASGKPAVYAAKGTKKYHYMVVRPRARETEQTPSPALGDQRINSFGVGGQMQVRSGLLTQEQTIRGPVVHFGLGEQKAGDALRIVWPNGTLRAEFELKTDQVTRADHRLNSSCPFLFAWDGEEWSFVTDCLWRSPLGLRINAQDIADVAITEDWVKIRGDQLRPRDGSYELRVTAELWETHFFDHLSLLAVDHPAGTEIWVDERFAVPPPPPGLTVTGPVRPLARATDDLGSDVTEVVAERDGRHVASFGLGRFQGVTRDHYLEVELPGDALAAGDPVYLLCHGWLRPTDSNVNVALSHSDEPAPSGLSLEVSDGAGGWRVAKEGLGFPSGKLKTVVLRVDDVLPTGAPPVLRLRTNLEIYWDQIAWAEGRPDVTPTVHSLAPETADLAYRGFSRISARDETSPELPESYEELEGTIQKWRDLEGYYTRFGDVRELVESVDDRYVILNAGDELRLRFAAPPEPAPGMVRDFALVSDGWTKDGNWNTLFSRTVLPLPTHDLPDYAAREPGRLEDDPVYRRHPDDWLYYHTRYVTPHRFARGLAASPALESPLLR